MTNPEEIYQKYSPMSKPASMTDIAFETGVITERERIIKLLEENLEGVLRFSNANLKTPVSQEIVMSSFTGDIIALIKGDNK